MIESDHLLLLSSSGYRDTMRRILFNRIERIYVAQARRLSGWLVLGLLLFMIDAAICTLFVISAYSVQGKIVLLVLFGWPLPILSSWTVFTILNPPHRLFIVRAGRPHEIRTTLSKAKFARFYSDLCVGIRQYQGQVPLAGAPTSAPPAEGAVAAEPAGDAEAPAVIEEDTSGQ